MYGYKLQSDKKQNPTRIKVSLLPVKNSKQSHNLGSKLI